MHDSIPAKTIINVSGMDCASCVAHVEKSISGVGGVQSCRVNLARGLASVEFDPARTNPEQIARAITEGGYPAAPQNSEDASAAENVRQARRLAEARTWFRRAMVGILLWLPVELAHWTMMLTSVGHIRGFDYVELAASTIAILYVGAGFYAGAWRGLRRGTTNMDTLIAMGTTVAYLYSLVAFVGWKVGWWAASPPLYFMEATGLLALISLGHWLEARARESAGSAIYQLLELSPRTARRRVNGAFDIVPVADVRVGDELLVRPGDAVPVDGVVIEGRSSIGESMISGEPLPVMRSTGDEVIGGTVNQEGRLLIRATKVGGATALAQIVALVEAAQSSKPPVQRLADRIAAVFVPAVLLVALATGIGWYAFGRMNDWSAPVVWARLANAVCSVLIIACPCALGLALPAALMVGTGRGARRGILIRDIDALQHAEKVVTVVLDKTGTITSGKPSVSKLVPLDRHTAEELLTLAASAEMYSEHPLAKAVVAAAEERKLSVPAPDSFENEAGFGVRAQVAGRTVLVGSEALLRKHGKLVAGYPPQPGAEQTMVHVGIIKEDGTIDRVGLILVADAIKPDSAEAIAELHAMKLRTVLLTGDNKVTANAIAKLAGIDEVYADVKPGEKAAIIKKLQERGGAVAMVGDGVNDAPALATANLGIALGSGSDVAKETGDIVLVGSSLRGVATAIRLSRFTMRKIRQNLFLAFIYNVLAIPLAAFGLLNPLIAAAAMALSDVSVIGNALLLRKARI